MLNANVKNYRRGLIVSLGNLNGNERLGTASDRDIHSTGLVLVSGAVPFLLVAGRELMCRSRRKKRRIGDRGRRKNHRKFVGTVRRVERDEVSLTIFVSRKLEIQSATHLVRCKTGSVARFCRQKSRGCVIGARTQDVKITIIIRRKMELKRLAGLHLDCITSPQRVFLIRRVNFDPVPANFMSSHRSVRFRGIFCRTGWWSLRAASHEMKHCKS